MSRYKHLNQAGDTIVEVLMATVIVAVVIAGAFALSNRSTRVNQSAYEKTDVANILREQLEVIRLDMKEGPAALDATVTAITISEYPECDSFATAGGSEGFFVTYDGSTGEITYNNGYNTINDIYYIWVEREVNDAGTHVDFTARACWDGIGDIEMQQTGIIMRLAIGD